MTQATGSPAFVQNQSDPRYSQFLKNGQDYLEMGQTFWYRYSGVVELISVVGPFVHVDHLPVGYQGIN